jgi:hypothetical protein
MAVDIDQQRQMTVLETIGKTNGIPAHGGFLNNHLVMQLCLQR